MNEKATDAIDYGYDATSFDNLPNDIYFSTNGWKLIIQVGGTLTKLILSYWNKTDARKFNS
jgi:hypothetical protein